MEVTALNEPAILEQARRGDLSSFSALVQAYQERAIHTAYAIVGNFEDARDIAQESFVKAYGEIRGFKEQSRFYTWFYRILVNTSKDFLRKKKVRRALSSWFGGHDAEEGADPAENAQAATKSALEELENRELGVQIFEAMERLPFRQRSIFGLRYLEGLSLEEIAASLGISTGAVKANLWQATEKMKKSLKGENP